MHQQPFSDRLCESILSKRAPVCVGLDPLLDRLPVEIQRRIDAEALKAELDSSEIDVLALGQDGKARERRVTRYGSGNALLEYGTGVIEAVADLVPAIKINIAFFEPFGIAGIAAYKALIRLAHDAGLLVIGDVKRADIGHTSAQYARATLEGTSDTVADSVTINPYFGWDGVGPFIEAAQKSNRGVFILVQTSNESAAQVQGLTLQNGRTVCQEVAGLVQEWAAASNRVGKSGYSCVGAVVSPRDLESTVLIREIMPNCLFLVPGFGAQGRTAEEVAKCFKANGTGAIVAASRSVIFAYNEPKFSARKDDWKGCIRDGCVEFVNSVRSVVGA